MTPAGAFSAVKAYKNVINVRTHEGHFISSFMHEFDRPMHKRDETRSDLEFRRPRSCRQNLLYALDVAGVYIVYLLKYERQSNTEPINITRRQRGHARYLF